MTRYTLEICVENAESLAIAVASGADRIELCAALALGGITPSTGLMQLAARLPVPAYALIRPRPGHFIYDEAEMQVMLADIEAARTAGLAGVVLGAMTAEGGLHVQQLATLIQAAKGLGTSLHRVVDVLTEPPEHWVEQAVALGFARVLTSGRKLRAIDGVADIGKLVQLAAGRVSIMPGAGITADTVGPLLAIAGVHEVHASCARPEKMDAGVDGPDFGRRLLADAGCIKALRQLLDRAERQKIAST